MIDEATKEAVKVYGPLALLAAVSMYAAAKLWFHLLRREKEWTLLAVDHKKEMATLITEHKREMKEFFERHVTKAETWIEKHHELMKSFRDFVESIERKIRGGS